MFYENAKERLLREGLDWPNTTASVLLVDENFSFDETDVFVSGVTGDEVTGGNYSRITLQNNTLSVDDGTTPHRVFADADDPTWVQLNLGTVSGVVVFEDTGDDGTSELICFDDTPDLVTSGKNVTWSIDSEGIFDIQ